MVLSMFKFDLFLGCYRDGEETKTPNEKGGNDDDNYDEDDDDFIIRRTYHPMLKDITIWEPSSERDQPQHHLKETTI